jgi:hypothetical protein
MSKSFMGNSDLRSAHISSSFPTPFAARQADLAQKKAAAQAADKPMQTFRNKMRQIINKTSKGQN